MSFIYEDKGLLDYLTKLAQPIDNQQDLELAKKLIKNLQTEVAGGTVFTSEKADANLDQADFSNDKSESILGNVLYFLQYNGIKANNKSIVLKAPGFDLDALGEDAKLYVSYPEKDAAQYYVYKDGLNSYVGDLKKKATGNPVFLANVAKLEQSITNELPSVVPTPNQKPGKPGQPGGPHDPNYKQVGYKQQGRQPRGQTQDLHKLLGKLPLLEDRVDFKRIENFIMNYTQITGESSSLVSAIDNALTYINNNFGNAGSLGVSLDTDSDQVAALLPPNATPAAFFSNLYALVTNVKQLLIHLKSISYDQMDEQLQQQLDQQVGTGPNDGNSIAYQNLADLNDLKTQSMKWRRTK
jgi:hypothetical protein